MFESLFLDKRNEPAHCSLYVRYFGAVCAVSFSMQAVAASMWDVTEAVWAVADATWAVVVAMWDATHRIVSVAGTI